MTNAGERLNMGLKVLQRLKPEMQDYLLPLQEGLEQVSRQMQAKRSQDRISPRPSKRGGQSDLERLIHRFNPLPAGTLVLGECDDGLPLTLDLSDPSPGALLVAGDADSGKKKLLKSLLRSAELLNAPGQAAYSIITTDPQAYVRAAQADHCQMILEAHDPAVSGFIQSLAQVVETRQRGSQRGPAIILVVDDLASFMQYIDLEGLRSFSTLLSQGPRVRVWTIASLRSGQMGDLDADLIQAFQTRLLGSINDAEILDLFNASPITADEPSRAGYRFSAPFGEEWIRFWVCDPD